MTNKQIDNSIDQTAISQEATPADKDETHANGVMMELNYAAPSHVSLSSDQQSDHTQHVALFTQLERDAVSFHGKLKDPLIFRDSLLALFDVVSSDYRSVPKTAPPIRCLCKCAAPVVIRTYFPRSVIILHGCLTMTLWPFVCSTLSFKFIKQASVLRCSAVMKAAMHN